MKPPEQARPDWQPENWYVLGKQIETYGDLTMPTPEPTTFVSTYAVVWRNADGQWRARRGGPSPSIRDLQPDEQRYFNNPVTAIAYAALTFQ